MMIPLGNELENFPPLTRRAFQASALNGPALAQNLNGTLADVVKLNVYLTDLSNFAKVNEAMKDYEKKIEIVDIMELLARHLA